jgi:hypothetical protein
MPIQGSDTADTGKEQPHHITDDAAWGRPFARIHSSSVATAPISATSSRRIGLAALGLAGDPA